MQSLARWASPRAHAKPKEKQEEKNKAEKEKENKAEKEKEEPPARLVAKTSITSEHLSCGGGRRISPERINHWLNLFTGL